MHFSVKDNGIGIEAEDAKQIFELYYRAERDIRNSVSCFGIGLYICSEIISHQ
ncbi:ATP-binding protein [Chryseobacterium indoltheticum]|uniref:ATP-binding protein n=1 Tax=Chryseobacterium indoltheticum TaxID=254 RepID=UPI0009FB12E2|nr:ATP-binding protein [Chryseobacterium indoltheticum]